MVRLVCLVGAACLTLNAAQVITISIKNTDSVAHSWCVHLYYMDFDGINRWHSAESGSLAAGATTTDNKQLVSGNKCAVRWGVDQGVGSSNCDNKLYDAMRADDGTIEYTVVGSASATTPNFEMVKVSISPAALTISENATDTFTMTRTGSTSYALAVHFSATGTATFSPTQDYEFKVGTTWVGSPVTIASASSSVVVVVYVWSDGVTPEPQETGTITLTDSTYLPANTFVLTIPIN
jgi:hypothetical protein